MSFKNLLLTAFLFLTCAAKAVPDLIITDPGHSSIFEGIDTLNSTIKKLVVTTPPQTRTEKDDSLIVTLKPGLELHEPPVDLSPFSKFTYTLETKAFSRARSKVIAFTKLIGKLVNLELSHENISVGPLYGTIKAIKVPCKLNYSSKGIAPHAEYLTELTSSEASEVIVVLKVPDNEDAHIKLGNIQNVEEMGINTLMLTQSNVATTKLPDIGLINANERQSIYDALNLLKLNTSATRHNVIIEYKPDFSPVTLLVEGSIVGIQLRYLIDRNHYDLLPEKTKLILNTPRGDVYYYLHSIRNIKLHENISQIAFLCAIGLSQPLY